MLSHSPHVEQGVVLASHAGIEVGSKIHPLPDYHHRLVSPSFGFEVAAGSVRPSPDEGASRVAIGFDVPALAFTGDLYFELPEDRFGSLESGFGVGGQIGPMPAALPYVELGRRLANDQEWFFTNAVGMVRPGPDLKWNLVWLPTIAYGGRDTGKSWHAFLTGIVGRRDGDCFRGSPCSGTIKIQRTFAIAGVAFETRWPRFRPPVLPSNARGVGQR